MKSDLFQKDARGKRGLVGPYRCWGKWSIVNADGSLWSEGGWQPNFIADQGELDVLNTWLRGIVISSKYLALLTSEPNEQTTMGTMKEILTPPTDGYSRQQILASDWNVPTIGPDGQYIVTAAQKRFGPATDAWPAISHIALVTTETGPSGLFLLALPASAIASVAIGQSFLYTLSVKALEE